MKNSANLSTGKKWNKRLAWLFLILFAVFWSLDPFFFWILLALSAYFGTMVLISSESFKGFFDSITQPQAQRPQPARPRPIVSETVASDPAIIPKFGRIAILIVGGLMLFFFVVGIFAGNADEGVNISANNSEITGVAGSVEWFDSKGNLAMDNQLYDSARMYYDMALAIDPQDRYALYNKALVYTLEQDYQRANGLARKCVRYHSDYDPAWWLLGYNYDLLNQVDSAIYTLEKAYRHGYSQPDFLYLLGEVYLKKNQKSNAREVFQKLIGLDSTKVEAYRHLAELDPSNANRYTNKANQIEQSTK